ncbi:hypothetical protein Mbo2_113 [Rhodococcus phage Mbo2]|uniref:Uncharacterized protein n=1 Tax=Rhodococcus phage Mbo2 TaxID=2936911 RepID=A0A9E7LH90_9CAUD|nr:hypothetical protein Mbo2_113 [Rhodococcus phage Mbo2]
MNRDFNTMVGEILDGKAGAVVHALAVAGECYITENWDVCSPADPEVHSRLTIAPSGDILDEPLLPFPTESDPSQ